MRFVFFSMRNFEREGGGTIRMYGVLNALAEEGNEVVFISNAKNLKKFNSKIKHIYIGQEISNQKKRIFQGLIAILPTFIISILYFRILKKIKKVLKTNQVDNNKIYFFEYLDNSLGYILKKRKFIKHYVNDIHGIATIEFEYQFKKARNSKARMINRLKYLSSNSLDRKVFNYADGIIYASEAMKEYYENKYSKVKGKKAYILPNALTDEIANKKIDTELRQFLLKKYNIKEKDFILFFAGGYKPTAGVDDLILAFSGLQKKYKNLKMILIGEGPFKNKCVNLVKENQIEDKVILINRVPYEDLATYQSIANVIICPDKQNPYSELIIHLKYFDSLSSGKLVINGGFKSVKEINKDDFLSLTFKPSDVKSLTEVIEKTINNFEMLSSKYQQTREYTLDNLTYKSLINSLNKL